MAFGRGKRGRKADGAEVTTTEEHSDVSETLPALNTDEVVSERTDFDTKAAKDGVSKAGPCVRARRPQRLAGRRLRLSGSPVCLDRSCGLPHG